jgi:hypothetical protein
MVNYTPNDLQGFGKKFSCENFSAFSMLLTGHFGYADFTAFSPSFHSFTVVFYRLPLLFRRFEDGFRWFPAQRIETEDSGQKRQKEEYITTDFTDFLD